MVSIHAYLIGIVLLKVNTILANSTLPSDLETEIRQIRIQLSASHIDRNKIALAFDQFNKTSGEGQVQDLVNHYFENYDDNLNNLLDFLHTLTSEVQQIGYQTFFELCEKKKMEIFSLLKIYNFIKKGYSDVEYLNNRIEMLIINTLVGTNLVELINNPDKNYIGLLSRPELEHLYPLVVQRVYQNDSNRTTELLGFLSQFHNLTNRIKFTHVLLKEVLPKGNLSQLSGILSLFRVMNNEVSNSYELSKEDSCLLVSMQKDFPHFLEPFMSDLNRFHIKNLYNNEYLQWYTDNQFNIEVLYTDKLDEYYQRSSTWFFRGTFFDEHSIIENLLGSTLMLNRCIHNDTFVRLHAHHDYSLASAGRALRSLWTIEADDKIHFVRIKNSSSGMYLSVKDNSDQDGINGVKRNVVLSKIADEKSKWMFEVNGEAFQQIQNRNFCY